MCEAREDCEGEGCEVVRVAWERDVANGFSDWREEAGMCLVLHDVDVGYEGRIERENLPMRTLSW